MLVSYRLSGHRASQPQIVLIGVLLIACWPTYFQCLDPLHKDPRTEVRRLLDKYHFDRYKMYNFATDLAQMTLTEAEQGEYARVER